jgi:hypothetical protein
MRMVGDRQLLPRAGGGSIGSVVWKLPILASRPQNTSKRFGFAVTKSRYARESSRIPTDGRTAYCCQESTSAGFTGEGIALRLVYARIFSSAIEARLVDTHGRHFYIEVATRPEVAERL